VVDVRHVLAVQRGQEVPDAWELVSVVLRFILLVSAYRTVGASSVFDFELTRILSFFEF
jgi:hypothetical protein